jgi:S-adenosyl methyltransferase
MNGGGIEGMSRPATAARIYDYYLGGIHNFAADQQAARQIIAQFPSMPLIARENRAFLRRAVRFLVDAGIDQFLDIGSGIPTEGNVHEIAQDANPQARVLYVDTDPVAVAESIEVLDGNVNATAIRGDLRTPADILSHRSVTALLDFDRPIALLLAAVLHFVPDDQEAYRVVAELVDALPAGSYLAISAAAAESFAPSSGVTQAVIDVYRQRTVTGARSRTHTEFERFFTGLEVIQPGVVWLHQWPEPDVVHPEFTDNPARSGEWAAIGRKA